MVNIRVAQPRLKLVTTSMNDETLSKLEQRLGLRYADERRIILPMTYSTDARAQLTQAAARRIDTAFYGVRALWT